MGLFSLVSSLVSVGGEYILLLPSLTNNGQADEKRLKHLVDVKVSMQHALKTSLIRDQL